MNGGQVPKKELGVTVLAKFLAVICKLLPRFFSDNFATFESILLFSSLDLPPKVSGTFVSAHSCSVQEPGNSLKFFCALQFWSFSDLFLHNFLAVLLTSQKHSEPIFGKGMRRNTLQ